MQFNYVSIFSGKIIIRRTEIGVLSDLVDEGFFYRSGWTYLGDYLNNDMTKTRS